MPYFHLVFTLPDELNGLIGIAPLAIYELLFAAVSAIERSKVGGGGTAVIDQLILELIVELIVSNAVNITKSIKTWCYMQYLADIKE